MQKIAILIALIIAGASADVSHLGGADGYDYPKPEIPFPSGDQNTYVPPDPPNEYLPPIKA